jgi:DNA-binding HxlR family transcriptional regulator
MKRVKEDRLGMQRIDVGCARRAGLTIEILFQGKWKAQILCAMRSGPIRLGQLARIVPGASKKMLTQNLRKLEADGIVVRKDLTDLVLHIKYELDESTREGVCALLDHLAKWGGLHLGRSRDDKE